MTRTATTRLGDLPIGSWFTLADQFDMWRVRYHWTTGVEIIQGSSTPERRVLSPDTQVQEV